MRKLIYTALAFLVLAGLSGCRRLSKDEVREYGEIGYSDIISFIVVGYQCQWSDMDPEEMKLSPVYRYCSHYAGFSQQDIDDDGFDELLLGEQFEDGSYCLYDIYCFNKKNASLIHLASGGERDYFTIGAEGAIIETGSNSADDSFTRAYRIRRDKLKELNDKDLDYSPIELELQKFDDYVHPQEK